VPQVKTLGRKMGKVLTSPWEVGLALRVHRSSAQKETEVQQRPRTGQNGYS
jgi:hypothetical protein